MPNIIHIQSIESPELLIYSNLSQEQCPKHQYSEGDIFITESLWVIERALTSGCIPISMLIDTHLLDHTLSSQISWEQLEDLPVYTAESDVLAKLLGHYPSRGICCAMYSPKLPTVDEVCSNAQRIVILEDIKDVGRMGSIFRAAAALNMDAILLTQSCCSPLDYRVSRFSMGTIFQIPWVFLDDDCSCPENRIHFLHKLGFKTISLSQNNATIRIDDSQILQEKKLALVFSELDELPSKTAFSNYDYTAKIPLAHSDDSLDISAIASIVFWKLSKN